MQQLLGVFPGWSINGDVDVTLSHIRSTTSHNACCWTYSNLSDKNKTELVQYTSLRSTLKNCLNTSSNVRAPTLQIYKFICYQILTMLHINLYIPIFTPSLSTLGWKATRGNISQYHLIWLGKYGKVASRALRAGCGKSRHILLPPLKD